VGSSESSFTTDSLHAFQDFVELCCITSVAFLPGWSPDLSTGYCAGAVPCFW